MKVIMEHEKQCRFVEEINKVIGPVIEIAITDIRKYPRFELRLAETDYVMRDQVVLSSGDKFAKLVSKIWFKYFGIYPAFNNTGRIFWFIPDAG